MKYGAQYVLAGDQVSRDALVETFRSWAGAQALMTYPGFDPADRTLSDTRIKYTLNTAVALPLAYTWSALRADVAVTPRDRQDIEGWLGRLLTFSSTPYDNAADYPQNNHGYLAAGVRMATGILAHDHQAFAAGVERYYVALHQMHPDGAFAWEVGRGACAIHYQVTAVRNVIAIAEMAASQGYDLYSLEGQGRSVHTALQFTLDALADPSIVDK
jgi:poly(beta-D-mannuronate) lyase